LRVGKTRLTKGGLLAWMGLSGLGGVLMRFAPCRLDAGMESPASCGDSRSLDSDGSPTEEVSTVGPESMIFVGEFVLGAPLLPRSDSSQLVDFEQIAFDAEGKYVAKALATLVNP